MIEEHKGAFPVYTKRVCRSSPSSGVVWATAVGMLTLELVFVLHTIIVAIVNRVKCEVLNSKKQRQ
jgi:hypothetical protein